VPMPKEVLAGGRRLLLRYVTGLVCLALIGCTGEPSPATSVVLAQGNIARGAYLTAVFCCQECHTVRQADDVRLEGNLLFAGGVPFPDRDGSVVHAANVTIASQYPEQVLEGIIRGRLAYKFKMPTDLYNGMAADDMRDIIAYLKTLRPILRQLPDNHLAPRFVLPPPNAGIPIPAHEPPAGTLERGEYLSRMFVCYDCHSPRDANGAYVPGHLFEGGGFQVPLPDGRLLSAPNLTPDRDTGLGAWSDAEIVRALRTGIERGGRHLNPMMPSAVAFHQMTDQDAVDLVRFLRSLKSVKRSWP
jgi:cytochrome c